MRELQQRLDSAEFAEWMAAFEIEPWGEDWKQTATLQATILNTSSKRLIRVEECLPGRAAKRDQSEAEMKARLDAFFKASMKRQEREAKRVHERQ